MRFLKNECGIEISMPLVLLKQEPLNKSSYTFFHINYFAHFICPVTPSSSPLLVTDNDFSTGSRDIATYLLFHIKSLLPWEWALVHYIVSTIVPSTSKVILINIQTKTIWVLM